MIILYIIYYIITVYYIIIIYYIFFLFSGRYCVQNHLHNPAKPEQLSCGQIAWGIETALRPAKERPAAVLPEVLFQSCWLQPHGKWPGDATA